MKNQTQTDYVVKQLEEEGSISRNQCLRKYISRLGAIIYDLRKEGMEIEGKYIKTKNGKDYVYFIVK